MKLKTQLEPMYRQAVAVVGRCKSSYDFWPVPQLVSIQPT